MGIHTFKSIGKNSKAFLKHERPADELQNYPELLCSLFIAWIFTILLLLKSFRCLIWSFAMIFSLWLFLHRALAFRCQARSGIQMTALMTNCIIYFVVKSRLLLPTTFAGGKRLYQGFTRFLVFWFSQYARNDRGYCKYILKTDNINSCGKVSLPVLNMIGEKFNELYY